MEDGDGFECVKADGRRRASWSYLQKHEVESNKENPETLRTSSSVAHGVNVSELLISGICSIIF